MDITNSIFPIRTDWGIMWAITLPALYRFFVFKVLGVITMVINKFFTLGIILIAWWIILISLEILVRKIYGLIVFRIPIGHKLFLLLIIMVFILLGLPVGHAFLLPILFITEVVFPHSLFQFFWISILNHVLNMIR